MSNRVVSKAKMACWSVCVLFSFIKLILGDPVSLRVQVSSRAHTHLHMSYSIAPGDCIGGCSQSGS